MLSPLWGSVITGGKNTFVFDDDRPHPSPETCGSFRYKEHHFHEIFVIVGSFHAVRIYEQNNNPFIHQVMGRMRMNRDSKGMVVIILVAAIVTIIVISSLYSYSGMSRPLTVVESKSMQHSDDTSFLGIIDTGDMAVMISPDKKNVMTYYEGLQNGYSKFGSYGDVIIYYREGKNPVIHRAILWLDYIDGVWSAPALKNLTKGVEWNNDGNWDNLTGILTLNDLPFVNSTRTVTINLDSMVSSDLAHSGYLTKGDHNSTLDQMSGIHNSPVEKEELKAIAGIEIPWLGCIKLLINHKNVDMIPKNSIPCLFLMIMDIIIFFLFISVLSDYRSKMKEKYL